MNIVLLAGGYSSRVGLNKLALPIGDVSVIVYNIKKLSQISNKIILVTGRYHEELSDIVKNLDVNIVYNKNYSQGMLESIKTGVNQTDDDFFILPADYPLVSVNTFLELLKTKKDIAVPTYKGKKGHPIFVRKKFKGGILEIDDKSNLREFRDSKDVHYIDVDDEGVILDIDTMNDYYKVINKWKGLYNEN